MLTCEGCIPQRGSGAGCEERARGCTRAPLALGDNLERALESLLGAPWVADKRAHARAGRFWTIMAAATLTWVAAKIVQNSRSERNRRTVLIGDRVRGGSLEVLHVPRERVVERGNLARIAI